MTILLTIVGSYSFTRVQCLTEIFGAPQTYKSKILKTHTTQLNMYMNNLTDYIFAVFSGELFACPCIQLQPDHSSVFICNQLCYLELLCGGISRCLQVLG